VDLSCAGLSRELLETELFGHQKGAFTGAEAAKSGLFEIANRGSIFLEEVGDVDPYVRPKLLKVLEEGRFRRLGDVRDLWVDVRFIAATHEELRLLVQEKRFRSDLYLVLEGVGAGL
jgi:transcriptional regulator with GAF, ATPase, and Fis domain